MIKRNTIVLITMSLVFTEASTLALTLIPYDIAYKKCQEGDANACFQVGEMAENGEEGERPDLYSAFKFYKMACKKGSPDGCLKQAKNYATGKASIHSNSKAVKFFKKACDGSMGKKAVACAETAEFFLELEKDMKREAGEKQKQLNPNLQFAIEDKETRSFIEGFANSYENAKNKGSYTEKVTEQIEQKTDTKSKEAQFGIARQDKSQVK